MPDVLTSVPEMQILLIEDNLDLCQIIKKFITQRHHEIDVAHNGEDGLEHALRGHYDVAIIDVMLPKLDGLAIVKKLREANIQTPILILSALSDVDNRVAGLRIGADDYLTKPFSMDELLARIEALYRRSIRETPTTNTHLLCAKNIECDLLKRRVKCNGAEIELQMREFELLEYLLRHKGQIVTRTMILENVWEYNFDPQTNIIDVHISRLRKKINQDGETIIRTVRGAGFIIDA